MARSRPYNPPTPDDKPAPLTFDYAPRGALANVFVIVNETSPANDDARTATSLDAALEEAQELASDGEENFLVGVFVPLKRVRFLDNPTVTEDF